MLLEFRFKNFKSFRDETAISLMASNDKSLPENLAQCPDDKALRILNSVAIYGANASGKSSIYEAFRFARRFISRSAKNTPDDEIETEPFMFDETSRNDPSIFEFTFIRNDVRYQYGFSVSRSSIHDEWLISYPKGRPRKLFERKVTSKDSKYTFSTFLKGEKEKLIELTHQSALFLSIGATFNNPQLIEPYRWFIDQTGYISSGEIDETRIFEIIARNKSLQRRIKDLLQFADLGIVDFSLTERDLSLDIPDNSEMPESLKKALEALKVAMDEITKDEKVKKAYSIRMTHFAGDRKLPLSWDAESEGTRRLLKMSVPILRALETNRTILVDEIDRSLHPLIVRELIKLYHNKTSNPKGSQIIFNTHDTSLLGAGIFRRDQIWFLEKDQSGVSHLYPLLEFSPRKNEALEKGYLQGRYGAIPFLSDSSIGGE